ncbi:hypothetical protein Plec18167_004326 [Paecilomyces lecythidis]|uniref:Spindle pole body associated protein SnaD n=1 Tax=Paecilomyces lecythidis TaxID=3004212 RepID=A0ABR3XTJ6_9EURO
MAGPGYSSPFPTTHDTIEASTLAATPGYVPSSPPHSRHDSDDAVNHLRNSVSEQVAAQRSGDRQSHRSRSSSPSSQASSFDGRDDLEARLADYTLDLSRFSAGEFGLDDRDDDRLGDLSATKEEEKLSDIGGPEDFTEHMERYLWGDGSSSNSKKNGDKPKEDEERLESLVEDDGELGEYSEFGPPVDMSTPSQFLRRNPHASKEVTQLEGIEESPPQSPRGESSPSTRRQRDAPAEYDSDDLRRQIEQLEEQLRERNQQLQTEREKVREAEEAAGQVTHLQAELSRKSALLEETHEKHRDEEAAFHEQIESLQRQNNEKDLSLQNSKGDLLRLEALEQQVETLQAELKRRDESLTEKDETGTIDSLKTELEAAREEIRKRDEALEDSISKLNEVTAAKDRQLQEKNTEIETLRAQISDRDLEIEKLEDELDAANDESEALEEKIASLESQTRPLEEKNTALETELGDVRSQLTAQEDALKAVASDISVPSEGRVEGKTFTDILDVIKGAFLTKMALPPTLPTRKTDLEEEVEHLRKQLTDSQKQSKETVSAKEALEVQVRRSQEQLTESQALITTVETENTRLTSRVDDLTSSLQKLQGECHEIKEQNAQLVETITSLRKEKETQQPTSPSSSPSESAPNIATTQEAHQAQLKSLQTAHATAISTLRSSHAESLRKLRNQLSASESRESELKSQLESLRASESEQRSEVEDLFAEIERLESIITAKEEAAAALDLRIAKSVEKREKEWERRIDLLLKEREKMSKALLWTWGEKEVGDSVKDNGDENRKGPRQGYRYKYVVRGSK